jgi:hypothetical protein
MATTPLSFQANANQLELSWPPDHLGWHLQVQTNDSGIGIGTHWTDLPGTISTNQVFFPVDSTSGSVFLRLTYP